MFRRPPSIVWVLLVLVLAVVIGAWKTTEAYGGASYWPQLAAGFAASLGAFVLALRWEGERERRRLDRDADALNERLRTEIRRRFEPIREELRRNLVSVESVTSSLDSKRPGAVTLLHPELLDGAWTANASGLTGIVADYGLTSKLAATYGRIDELRWRLRQRTSTLAVVSGSTGAVTLLTSLDRMTRPLAAELQAEISDLLERVNAEIEHPTVQPLGLLHRGAATVLLKLTVSGHEG